MRQPELGKIVTNLRNEKGLTQEELVEKCNISVRTIQRIEAGEVTPRSFTIKTILAALDYDLEKIKSLFPKERELSNLNVEKKYHLLLNLAFVFGILYFFIGFVEVYLDIDLEFLKKGNTSNGLYVTVKLISFISMFFFYTGFLVSGTIFSNYLLRISSIILLLILGIGYAYDILYWYSPNEFDTYFMVIFSITIGCSFIIHGIGIIRLKEYLETNLPTITGIFLIVTGATLITILLFLIGIFFMIPLTIFQVILLYKIKEVIKNNDKKSPE